MGQSYRVTGQDSYRLESGFDRQESACCVFTDLENREKSGNFVVPGKISESCLNGWNFLKEMLISFSSLLYYHSHHKLEVSFFLCHFILLFWNLLISFSHSPQRFDEHESVNFLDLALCAARNKMGTVSHLPCCVKSRYCAFWATHPTYCCRNLLRCGEYLTCLCSSATTVG